jgi:branched-subunit amino acid aminotransferase/4-amino-4-deoxychorismate lyase
VELAAADHVDVRERDVMPAEISGFDGAMLCGTLSEIRWINRIDEHCYGSSPHPLIKHLIDRFRVITHS